MDTAVIMNRVEDPDHALLALTSEAATMHLMNMRGISMYRIAKDLELSGAAAVAYYFKKIGRASCRERV